MGEGGGGALRLGAGAEGLLFLELLTNTVRTLPRPPVRNLDNSFATLTIRERRWKKDLGTPTN
jgi:hypothetical protein